MAVKDQRAGLRAQGVVGDVPELGEAGGRQLAGKDAHLRVAGLHCERVLGDRRRAVAAARSGPEHFAGLEVHPGQHAPGRCR